MRKKFLSAFLLGAVTLAATSTVVSCKDYDDDISSLQSQIDKNAADLQAAKTALEGQIATLKTQLEQKDIELQQAINANSTSITTLQGVVAGLETRIAAAESAIININNVLATKVDQVTFNAKVTELLGEIAKKVNLTDYNTAIAGINGQLESLGLKDIELDGKISTEEQARISAVQNLQDQINALNAYKARVEANETMISALGVDVATMKDEIEALQTSLSATITKVAANEVAISELQTAMGQHQEAIDKLNAEVDILTVLVQRSLRSLVFDVESYYYGIEAMAVSTLDCDIWNLPAADADKQEAKYSERVEKTSGSTTLPAVASYFMNPSCVKAEDIKAVNIISGQKDYILNRAEAPISAEKYAVEGGKLNVNLKFANAKEYIKSIKENQKVTVFAAQATIAKGSKDTTITSDFAALMADTMKNVKLSVVNPIGIGVGYECNGLTCPTTVHTGGHAHMYDTESVAASFGRQKTVVYNGSIDLSKIVETHYATNGGTHKLLTADNMAKYGFEYKYELVGYFVGTNKTSESAHARIEGTKLYPQDPKWNEDHTVGTHSSTATAPAETSIGRTPMVRVSLIDTKNNNRVIDYGYIKIEIVDKAADPTQNPTADALTYPTMAPITYNWECDGVAYAEQKMTWAWIESQVYALHKLSRTQFDAAFEKDLTSGNFTQYVVNAQGNYVAATAAQIFGTIAPIVNTGSAATDVASWSATAAQVKTYLRANPTTTQIVRYIRFKSVDPTKYGDIYIKLSTGAVTINKPTAKGLSDANKIAENWYTKNSSTAGSGKDEVHAQTINPEDATATAKAEVLDYNIYNVWVGNKLTVTEIDDKTAGKDYADSKLAKNVIFSGDNTGKEFKADLNGQIVTYTLGVSADGKSLIVTKKNGAAIANETIAKIVDDKVKYQHGEAAEALLNYKAHNALADDVLNVVLQLQASRCDYALPLENSKWNVRFLRPINVAPVSEKKFVDASHLESELNINLIDLVTLTDWRDKWNPTGSSVDYWSYYNIKKIEIVGGVDGSNVATVVKANLNQSDATNFVTLSSITNKIKLTYSPLTPATPSKTANYGKLTYENQGNTVGAFQLQIPVKVSYEWGAVYTVVTVNVDATTGGNGARKN